MEIVSDSKLLLINLRSLLGKRTVLLISTFYRLNYKKKKQNFPKLLTSVLPDLRLIKTAREAGSRLRHVLRNKCYPPVSSQKYKEDYHYFRRLDLVGLFLRATKMVKGLHA